MTLQPGTRLGQYEILGLIGKGGIRAALRLMLRAMSESRMATVMERPPKLHLATLLGSLQMYADSRGAE